MNDEGKKVSNVEIAKLVAARGHDFDKVLENLDAGRSPEQEEWYKEQCQAELEAYEASYNSKVHKSR